MIPYGRQNINDEDIAAVVATLRSDWLTQGPAVPEFEKAIALYCGARYAVAVNSATSALHIAYLALGLSHGKRLWTTPNTFVATANAALMCGAQVDFVDIDPDTQNLSVLRLEEKLALANRDNCLPDIVVPVHFSGRACYMAAIHALSKQYGFAIVEDASHAIGGEYLSGRIGNGAYADCTVFSFHPVKLITTGEGGMVLTQRNDLWEKLIRLRSHGITRDPLLMVKPQEGEWYYEQLELGWNYRMPDILAALGKSQLARLDQFVECRRTLAERYNRSFEYSDLITPFLDKKSAWHLYVVQLPVDVDRRRVFEQLRVQSIGVNVHYIPVHLQPYYATLGFRCGQFPEAERYYRRALSLPLYPGLTNMQQDFVVDALAGCLT